MHRLSVYSLRKEKIRKKNRAIDQHLGFLKNLFFFKVFVAFLFMLIKFCVNKWLFNDNHPSPRVYILFKIKDIQVTENREKQEILIFSPPSHLNYHS